MTPQEYEILRNLEKKNAALEAQVERLKDEAEAWAKEELVIQQGKREYFRTMFCDNCENYRSDRCRTCFSHGYVSPVNFTPAKHFLFREPHPKDAQIARLRAMIQELKCCGNCKWDVEADEEFCDGCCMPELDNWEAR
jgi:hypothetical protein